MYRHLLVPIDDTDLSIEVVGNAVGLARAVGARITFFHAVCDPARAIGGDAELLRAMAYDDFAYAYTGKARELLAKAEAAARAFGVPCGSLQRPGDNPATAIIEAARAGDCDLIFMASHGHHGRLGMALASETLSVLMNAGLPVLVSATGNLQTPAHAIGIIRDEHRALAAVMHTWMRSLAAARKAGVGADVAQMRDVVRYVQTVPVALHHPKEEHHLFQRLRERTGEFDAELDELRRQHLRDEQLVAALAAQVEALADCVDDVGSASATCALDDAVQAYARFLWDHLGREEGVILPAAQRHLLEQDWIEIDSAFRANRSECEGPTGWRQLFSRSVNTAPP